jgi:phage portal protein BeeE
MAGKPGDRMNKIQSFVGKQLAKMAAYAGITLSLTSERGWGGLRSQTYTGKTVDEDSAMGLTGVFGCVRVLAETKAQLPMAVFERGAGDNNATKVDHEVGDILINQPNTDMTGMEYGEAVTVNIALAGNGYSLREVNGAGNVVSLYPVAPHCMVPQRNARAGGRGIRRPVLRPRR